MNRNQINKFHYVNDKDLCNFLNDLKNDDLNTKFRILFLYYFANKTDKRQFENQKFN